MRSRNGSYPHPAFNSCVRRGCDVDLVVQLDDADGAQHPDVADAGERAGRREALAEPGVHPLDLTGASRPWRAGPSMRDAAAQASGLAIKVGPCMRQPASPPDTTCATSLVHSIAARLKYPPVKALPTHMMSGLTPARSAANNVPVRPKPVAISSRTSRAPCSSHTSRSTRT